MKKQLEERVRKIYKKILNEIGELRTVRLPNGRYKVTTFNDNSLRITDTENNTEITIHSEDITAFKKIISSL
jgi:hypothetical protein